MKDRTSLDRYVAEAIRNYPTLFKNRTDVLQHLFFVNGNGLEWVDGMLIDRYDNAAKDRARDLRDEAAELAECAEPHEEDGIIPEAHRRYYEQQIARIRTGVRKHNLLVQFTIDHADMLALMPWDRELHSIYPICEYAKMCNVPDDVKPDWLAGIREMIFALFACDVTKKRPDRTDAEHENERQQNIAWCDKVLQDLTTRFGTDGCPTSHAEWSERSRANREKMAKLIIEKLGAIIRL